MDRLDALDDEVRDALTFDGLTCTLIGDGHAREVLWHDRDGNAAGRARFDYEPPGALVWTEFVSLVDNLPTRAAEAAARMRSIDTYAVVGGNERFDRWLLEHGWSRVGDRLVASAAPDGRMVQAMRGRLK